MEMIKIDINSININDLFDNIANFEKNILNGTTGVTSKKDWIIFKKSANNMKDNYSSHLDFCYASNRRLLGNTTPIAYRVINYICECINQVEQNYTNDISQEDIIMIMHQIRILCMNNSLKCQLDNMSELTACKYQYGIASNYSGLTTEKDFYGDDYIIEISDKEVFDKIVKSQEELSEDYKKAHEFVFGEQLRK